MKQLYFALVSRRDASALLIAAAVLMVYANSLENPFHYDDRHSIVENHHLRDLGNIPAFFTQPEYFSRDPDKAMYRPLLLVSFALNHAWGEYDPQTYHIVNILLHLGCSLLVWGILRQLVQAPCLSLLGALFFALHPVASEPVNYISSRSELMAAAGLLGGLLLYLHAGRRYWLLGVSSLCFAAGLLAKSVALALPLWILILEWHRGGLRASWSRLWPYGLIALGYVGLVWSFVVEAVFAAPVRTWPEQLGTQIKALIYYAQLLFAPFELSIDHAFVPADLGTPVVWLCALALASLLLWMGGLFRVGVLWMGVALAPTLLVPLNVLVNEHRLYLPLVGLVVALLGMRSLEAVRGLRWGAPLLLAFLALLTWERNRVWSDEAALWGDAARKNPDSVRPLVYLGNAAREKGEPQKAASYYRQVLELEANHPTARANLGNAYQDLGHYALSIEIFVQLLEDHPEMTDLHYSLGRVLQVAARGDEARAQYQSLPLDSPHRPLADNNLGTLFEEMGKVDSALYYYRRADELVQAQANRTRLFRQSLDRIHVLFENGEFGRAEMLCRVLLAADADHRDAGFLLSVSLFYQARYSESIVENQRLVERYPYFDEGLLQLAHALESSGRFEEAQSTYQTLLKRTSSAEMGQIGRERLDALEERMP